MLTTVLARAKEEEELVVALKVEDEEQVTPVAVVLGPTTEVEAEDEEVIATPAVWAADTILFYTRE